MRILFLSAWHPYPPDNGARLRIFNILSGLSEYHELTLLTFADDEHLNNVGELKELCHAIHVLPKTDYDPGSRRAILGLFGGKPRVLADLYNPEMNQMIMGEISHGHHDLIIASQIYMADYLSADISIPMVFEEAEIGVFTDAARYSENLIKRTRYQMTLSKLGSYYQQLLPRFVFCTVASETEKQLLQELAPQYRSIEVIPNGVNLADYQGVNAVPQPGKIIFSGALTYTPNYEAMQWFSTQVLPRVLRDYPDAQLTITGNHGGRTLPEDPHVCLVGFVDDIQERIASSWISIAPIFAGGGTRLKILEAFGLRTPVIATSKGAQGLDVQHNKHLLVADTAESFAQETIRLLNDADLRQELVTNAYQLVLEKYDWSVIIPKYLSLIDEAVAVRNPGFGS